MSNHYIIIILHMWKSKVNKTKSKEAQESRKKWSLATKSSNFLSITRKPFRSKINTYMNKYLKQYPRQVKYTLNEVFSERIRSFGGNSYLIIVD